MRIRCFTLLFFLLFFIEILAQSNVPSFPCIKNDIDYSQSFSNKVKKQANFSFSRSNLKPMLDIGISIPNAGIYRFFPNAGWNIGFTPNYTSVFEESPYQQNSSLRYNRFDWYILEEKQGIYRFDAIIEPMLHKAYQEHSRVILGLACICGSSDVKQKFNGRSLAMPIYLYEKLLKTDFPAYEDELYGPAYIANYDSPLLLNRYKALLEAFSRWIEHPLKGTNLKRKDLIYGIEMRYMGYWGEGAVASMFYPESQLIDEYLQAYADCFPDILLVGGGIEMKHLPTWEDYNRDKKNMKYNVAMRHVYKLLSMQNHFGRVGLFIDSWSLYNDMYDCISRKVLYDSKQNVISLAKLLNDSVWGKVYVTGEFGFIGNSKYLPYSGLYQQFSTRHLSGISVHNLTIKEKRGRIMPSVSICQNVKKCLSMIGYRLVLGNPQIKKMKDGCEVSFLLTNIGVSRVFHNCYELYLIVKDEKNDMLCEHISQFDLRSLAPTEVEPLLYDPKNGCLIVEKLPVLRGKVYLMVRDRKGIEYPMCLSNYGRLEDGSYFLGDI